MRYTDEVLEDIDFKVKTLSGDHYETLKAEFVDWANDARVSTVREMMDLGLPRDVAENILYYLREVARGIDGTMKVRYAEDVSPAEEVAA
jgi:hypothetical protein